MSTANFENWDGNIADLGPIYPFVGWEGFMVVLCIVFWIGWHVVQIKMENKKLDDQTRDLRRSGRLQQALTDEHSIERM
jgi:hypothetical protein